MGRTPHIQAGAKGTTIYLTKAQKLAFRKLQAKRMEDGLPEPLLTEAVLEGFQLLLRKEGWSDSELASLFPKGEVRRAKVRVFSKRRRANQTA